MSKCLKLLHLATGKANPNMWTDLFKRHLREIGELTLREDTGAWDDREAAEVARDHDVILTHWGSRRLPEELAEEPGRLRYILNMSGTIRPFVPRKFVEKGMAVTNWGDLPANQVAEGALTLLLASLKQLIPQRKEMEKGGWAPPDIGRTGSIRDLRIGIYGLGSIGRKFAQLVEPIQPRLYGFDPYLDPWPENVRRTASIAELFSRVEAVVITAGLNEETRHSVGAAHLALLPDQAIVVNVARGAVLDQEALFRELESGRLRAGLDVLDTNGRDFVDADHPCRHWPNLILTAHKVSSSDWNRMLYEKDSLSRHQKLALENLQRFASGQPLLNRFDLTRYDRST
ncbi:MAG: NAD(P)-dependent oxidoreductase [Oceanipulchritudo sp.]